MSFQTLTFEIKDGVALVKLFDLDNEPTTMIQRSDELADFCEEIAWDEKSKVVLLTGAGENAFSIISNNKRSARPYSFAEPISKMDRPVIAAIGGDATGQGLELALACDLRIAAETSRFGLPQINTGLIPWDGGTQRLSRIVGIGKALEMILTGEMIDAREAYRIGLINQVVSPGELMTVATEKAREMASKGPIASRYAKEAVCKGIDMTLEQGLRFEADLYLLLHTTKDRAEGITGFREKRTPRFEGR